MNRDKELRKLTNEMRLRRRRMGADLERSVRPAIKSLQSAWRKVEQDTKKIQSQAKEDLRGVDGQTAISVIKDRLSATEERLERSMKRMSDEMSELSDGVEERALGIGFRHGAEGLKVGGVEVDDEFTEGRIREIKRISSSSPFISRMDSIAPYYSEWVVAKVIERISSGTSIHKSLASSFGGLRSGKAPLVDTVRMMRTLQSHSAREATREIYQHNGVKKWIWVASLDGNTCPSCVAMHGSVHPIKKKLNDHHFGRCVMVPVTPTWEELGFSGGGDPEWQTGDEWLRRQPASTQKKIMGPGLYSAWSREGFTFNQKNITMEYDNDVFGKMRTAAPLSKIISRTK